MGVATVCVGISTDSANYLHVLQGGDRMTDGVSDLLYESNVWEESQVNKSYLIVYSSLVYIFSQAYGI